MKVTIVHLSDLHIQSSSEDRKHENILNGVRECLSEISDKEDYLFLIFTGDIAYSGLKNEYEKAKLYFYKIKEEINPLYKKIYLLFTPGNHDCDFSDEKKVKVRDLIIKSLRTGEKIDNDIVNEVTNIQENYRDFVSSISPDLCETGNLLNSKNYFSICNDDVNITINLLNTAWMSFKHEEKKIIMPNELIDLKGHIDSNEKINLVISAFHHPCSWLESSSEYDFRHNLEMSSNIILTGHEHVEDQYTKVSKNNTVYYSRSGELDGVKPMFRILQLDEDESYKKISTCDAEWSSEMSKFIRVNKEEVILDLNKNRVLHLNKDYEEKLNELGMVLTHKRKDKLYLDDVFIYPNLSRKVNKKDESEVIIKSKSVIDTLIDNKFCILFGDSGSGKTSLMKKVYREYYKRNFFPVFIKSEILVSPSSQRFSNIIEKEIIYQYGRNEIARFFEFNKNKRVLFVDDYHLINNNVDFKKRIHNSFDELFGNIILSSNEFNAIDFDISNEALLNKYIRFKIDEFSPSLRLELAKKWYDLNNIEDTEDRIDYLAESAMDTISNLIKSNFMPSSPYILLMLLNAQEVQNLKSQEQTLYGHLLHMIITKSMIKAYINSDDLNESFKILNIIAYYLFKNKTYTIAYDDYKQIILDYNSKYAIDINAKAFLDQQCKANILDKVYITSSNRVKEVNFKYGYLYSYFVAEYMAHNINEKLIVKDLKEIVDNLYLESNSRIFINIWYFKEYFTNNDDILFDLLEYKTQNTFAHFKPYKFETPAKCIAKITSEKKTIISMLKAIDDDIVQHKKERLQIEDQNSKLAASDCKRYNDDEKNNYEESKDYIEVLTTINIINTIKQIIKCTAGTLDKNAKEKLIKCSYGSGMKLLSYLYSLFENNFDSFIEYFQNVLIKNTNLTLEQAYEETVNLVQNMLKMSSYSIIYQIAESLAHEKLKISMKTVKGNDNSIGFELVDIACNYNFLKNESTSKVMKFIDNNEKDIFVMDILKLSMWQYYYYNKTTNERDRQKILGKLKINVSKVLIK